MWTTWLGKILGQTSARAVANRHVENGPTSGIKFRIANGGSLDFEPKGVAL